MGCSTLQDGACEVIVFSNNTTQMQLFAEVINFHCVNIEKDRIVFLHSVPDQLMCIKTNAHSQKTEENLFWIQVWHQESMGWTLGLILREGLTAPRERWGKWLVGAAWEWKRELQLLKKLHWDFLQDESRLISPVFEVCDSDTRVLSAGLNKE